MAKNSERTAEDVKETVAILKKLLAKIDPSAKITARGSLEYGELGLNLSFGNDVGGCGGGCFGCAGCDGCSGCGSTEGHTTAELGVQVSNPNPAIVRY